jgi:hypothetical protein
MGRRAIRAGYVIDDQTAIKVVDGNVEIVSEGHWKLWARARAAKSPLAPGSGMTP